jgi:hypothetical protein
MNGTKRIPGWLGREGLNLPMTVSKSDYLAFEINAHSEKSLDSTPYRPNG